MPGYWNAHSDRDWEGGGSEDHDPVFEAEEAARLAREEAADLKATIMRLAADVGAAMRWAADYEREHGPFKATPPIPDFMIPF